MPTPCLSLCNRKMIASGGIAIRSRLKLGIRLQKCSHRAETAHGEKERTRCLDSPPPTPASTDDALAAAAVVEPLVVGVEFAR